MKLRQLWDKVLCCFDRAVVARETGDDAAIRDVYRIEDEVDDLEEELRDKHIKRLSDGKCLPSNGVVFLDILSNLERMSDHAKILRSVFRKKFRQIKLNGELYRKIFLHFVKKGN